MSGIYVNDVGIKVTNSPCFNFISIFISRARFHCVFVDNMHGHDVNVSWNCLNCVSAFVLISSEHIVVYW
uniref:Uncharacterized protein n=1 Tax=Arundo donax TaxID=35708 RepID=A0A0A9EDN3_ARUDO